MTKYWTDEYPYQRERHLEVMEGPFREFPLWIRAANEDGRGGVGVVYTRDNALVIVQKIIHRLEASSSEVFGTPQPNGAIQIQIPEDERLSAFH